MSSINISMRTKNDGITLLELVGFGFGSLRMLYVLCLSIFISIVLFSHLGKLLYNDPWISLISLIFLNGNRKFILLNAFYIRQAQEQEDLCGNPWEQVTVRERAFRNIVWFTISYPTMID